MKYRKLDAKDYARRHLRGIWAAALNPFTPDLALDEDGLRRNLRHWYRDLGLAGIFVSGKQGEFFSMSLAERKRTFEIAVEEAAAAGGGCDARRTASLLGGGGAEVTPPPLCRGEPNVANVENSAAATSPPLLAWASMIRSRSSTSRFS